MGLADRPAEADGERSGLADRPEEGDADGDLLGLAEGNALGLT